MSSSLTAQSLSELSDNLAMLVETVAGYRAKCEAAGFSPTAAEKMSIDLHRELIIKAFMSSDSR